MGIAIKLLGIIIFGMGIVSVQIYISRKRKKWYGLILPAVFLGISIAAVLMLALTPLTSHYSGTTWFAFYNVPTATLLVLYAVCRVHRSKRQKLSELQKMSIQDLG